MTELSTQEMNTGSAVRRALFIVPPTGMYIREDRCQTPIEEMKTIALRPPVDLMYTAASAERAGVECRLTDFPAERKSWSDLERELREFQPDILVLSITTPTLAEDVRAAGLARELNPKCLTVAKGAHFLRLDIEALEQYSELSCVVRGEYEHTVAELCAGKPLAQIAGVTWRDEVTGEITRN